MRFVSKHQLCFFAALGLAVACGRPRAATLKDLATGRDSNIAASGGSQTVSMNDIESIHILPNTNVPKGVVVSLVKFGAENNYAFVRDLYRQIAAINRTEGLVPTRTLSHPTRDQLMRQEITLIVLVPTGYMGDFESLLDSLGGRNVPYVIPMEISTTYGDSWIQDFGEFAMVKLKDAARPSYLVLDTYRNHNRQEYDPAVFQQEFRIPLVRLGANKNISGQYGGNIEATPDGTLYMGNAVDSNRFEPTTGSDLYTRLESFGNANAVKLASNWLNVGHVDEFLTFTPSRRGCGSTLFYGRPLEALQLLVEQASDAEFKSFSDEWANQVLASSRGGPPTQLLDVHLTRESLRQALAWFKRDPNVRGIPLDLAAYDLNRHEPAWDSITAAGGMNSDQLASLRQSGAFARFYVWRNLVDQQAIEQNVRQLESSLSCHQTEALPEAFLPDFYSTQGLSYYSGDSAHLPGMANSLVLRDHVIVPDPGVEALRRTASERFGRHLNSADGVSHVHFVNDAFYHEARGEIHCGTNVIREMTLRYQTIKPKRPAATPL